MFKQSDLAIGSRVLVTATAVTRYQWEDPKLSDHKILTITECTPFVAWVVGVQLRFEGIHHMGSNSSFPDWDNGEPSWFEKTKSVQLWQVKKALIGPILEARLQDLADASHLSSELHSPFKLKPKLPPISDEYRQILRRDAALIKRDSQGRWLKVNQ